MNNVSDLGPVPKIIPHRNYKEDFDASLIDAGSNLSEITTESQKSSTHVELLVKQSLRIGNLDTGLGGKAENVESRKRDLKQLTVVKFLPTILAENTQLCSKPVSHSFKPAVFKLFSAQRTFQSNYRYART